MTRTNYRVLAYYKDDMYSKEVYIFIINARNRSELEDYLRALDIYYEVLEEDKCDNLSVVQHADSILIEGQRIYKDNPMYQSALDIIGGLYF